jgi:hypothetical protein
VQVAAQPPSTTPPPSLLRPPPPPAPTTRVSLSPLPSCSLSSCWWGHAVPSLSPLRHVSRGMMRVLNGAMCSFCGGQAWCVQPCVPRPGAPKHGPHPSIPGGGSLFGSGVSGRFPRLPSPRLAIPLSLLSFRTHAHTHSRSCDLDVVRLHSPSRSLLLSGFLLYAIHCTSTNGRVYSCMHPAL